VPTAGRRSAALTPRPLGSTSHPVPWTRAQTPRSVAGVGVLTAIEREAPTPDALGEPDPKPLELGDPLVDPGGPLAGQARPVATSRRMGIGKLRQLGADLLEREPDPLGKDDERDPPENSPRVAAAAGAGPVGSDQSLRFVEPKGGRRDAAPA